MLLYVDELDDNHWLMVVMLQIVLYGHDQVVSVLNVEELDDNRCLTVILLQIVLYDHDMIMIK